MPHELILSDLLQPPLIKATLCHVGALASQNHPNSRYMKGTFRVFNAEKFAIERGEWEAGAYSESATYRFEPIIIIPQTGDGEVFTSENLEEKKIDRLILKKIAIFINECLIELAATKKELIDNDMHPEEAKDTEFTLIEVM
ncbi:MAG: hypothetical protein EXS60_00335 [Candidatus Pacebacteria bacterium]|nr:hypothetical protein [Candidatus Paceibacterota bacterium]